jgi:hypothetical protein
MPSREDIVSISAICYVENTEYSACVNVTGSWLVWIRIVKRMMCTPE